MLPATHCMHPQIPLLLAPQLSLLARLSTSAATGAEPHREAVDKRAPIGRCIPHPLRDNNGAPVVGPHSTPCRSVIAACTR